MLRNGLCEFGETLSHSAAFTLAIIAGFEPFLAKMRLDECFDRQATTRRLFDMQFGGILSFV